VDGPDRRAYNAGASLSTVRPSFPASGGVGMITSRLENAAQASQGFNTWHTVGLLRIGTTAWIFDPMYVMGTYDRLSNIPGLANVVRLLGILGKTGVTEVQILGLGSELEECMGQSARWVDAVIRAPGAPYQYPEETFVVGQLTPGWQRLERLR